ncbi:hypothetical protein [Acutalibacter sp. 1XD8-36]|uniref:hypothetical protein n=1 Tax=Acutalibacter sp. 1XD8-36 TaxID=2320852 RepID=UPI00141285E2|nr:hypothetical protein [Acutalibacter sp. 1XD8-36]
MKTTAKKLTSTVKTAYHDLLSHRQSANYERFMQQKADVFQVTDVKDQAMFWVMN